MAKKDDHSDLVEEPGKGHNSLAKAELNKIIDNLEALNEQKSAITEAIRDVMAVAKSKGLDPRSVREMVKLRALDVETRHEREDLRDLYMVACGLVE